MPTESKTLPQRHREKIAASHVLGRLIKHFSGELELTPSQVNVGLKLLNKITPDLRSVEVEQIGEVNHAHSFDEESIEQAAGVIRAALQSVRAGDTEEDT